MTELKITQHSCVNVKNDCRGKSESTGTFFLFFFSFFLCNLRWSESCSKAVKPLCFSLALPGILLLSDPNPFHLLVLSNFTQSSRSLSRKRGIWPRVQKTVPFSCLPAADRQLRGRRSPRNYEGYFRRSNLKNTWDVNRTHSEETNTLSRSKEINNQKRWVGGGGCWHPDTHQGAKIKSVRRSCPGGLGHLAAQHRAEA